MSWLQRLLRTRRMEKELDSELRFHFESQVADKVAGGLPEAEARRATRLEFGGLEQVKEDCRESRGTLWLASIMQDLRFGVRMLMRSPGFALTSILVLALGIGVNTAVFTLVHTILLRQLPFRDPGKVLNLDNGMTVGLGWDMASRDWSASFRNTAKSLSTIESAALYAVTGANVNAGTGTAVRLQATETSAQFFDTLGIVPQLGRVFRTDEDTPGNDHVALISHRLWQSSLNSDPDVVGRVLHGNGFDFTIVGVLPAAMDFPGHSDLWTPTIFDQHTALRESGAFLTHVIVRMRSDVSIVQVQAEFKARARQKFQPESSAQKISPEDLPKLTPIEAELTKSIRFSLWMLMGAVSLVLLIAAANIASLMLVRTAGRRAEFAIRIALGAARERLLQQQLVESIMIALAGGALGVALAQAALRLLYHFRPAALAPFASPAMELPVLLFTAAVALLTGFAFGIFPGWLAGREDPATVLQTGVWRSSSRGTLFRKLLIAAEMGLAFVLLVGVGLLLRTMANLDRVPLGFDTRNIASFSVALHGEPFEEKEVTTPAMSQFFSVVLDKLSALPGVAGAAAISNPPLDTRMDMFLPVRSEKAAGKPVSAAPRFASRGYFTTMGILMFQGRDFSSADTRTSERVVIVTRDLAEKLWPGQDAVGRRLYCEWYCEVPPLIIGVVGTGRRFGPRDRGVSEYYFPYAQQDWPYTTFVMRTSLDPATLLLPIRHAIASVYPSQPIFDFETMQQRLSENESLVRFELFTLSVFAGLSVLLVAIGLYGTISYTVTQRTRELGLRLALGAQRRRILLQVIRETAFPTAVGSLLGVIASYFLTRLLSSVLFGIKPHDPLTLLSVTTFFVAIGTLAAYFPARRAANLQPMQALRVE